MEKLQQFSINNAKSSSNNYANTLESNRTIMWRLLLRSEQQVAIAIAIATNAFLIRFVITYIAT